MTEEIILSQQEYDELISICTTNRDKYSKLAKKYKELLKTTEEFKSLQEENEKLRKQAEEVLHLQEELDKALNRIIELENSHREFTHREFTHREFTQRAENSQRNVNSQQMTGGTITTPAKKTAVKEMFSYL